MQKITGELLTVSEVAEPLRVPDATVTRWCREGRIEAIALPRGWRIPRESLDRFLSENYERKTRGADEAGE